jgi:hypothetical protein
MDGMYLYKGGGFVNRVAISLAGAGFVGGVLTMAMTMIVWSHAMLSGLTMQPIEKYILWGMFGVASSISMGLLFVGASFRDWSKAGLLKLNEGPHKFKVGDKLRVRPELLDNYYVWFLGTEDELTKSYIQRAAAVTNGCKVHKIERNGYGNWYRIVYGAQVGFRGKKEGLWVRVPEFMLERVEDAQ